MLAGTSANKTTAKQAATKTKVERDALKLNMPRSGVIAAFAVPADIAFPRQILAKCYQIKQMFLLLYCRKLHAVRKISFTELRVAPSIGQPSTHARAVRLAGAAQLLRRVSSLLSVIDVDQQRAIRRKRQQAAQKVANNSHAGIPV